MNLTERHNVCIRSNCDGFWWRVFTREYSRNIWCKLVVIVGFRETTVCLVRGEWGISVEKRCTEKFSDWPTMSLHFEGMSFSTGRTSGIYLEFSRPDNVQIQQLYDCTLLTCTCTVVALWCLRALQKWLLMSACKGYCTTLAAATSSISRPSRPREPAQRFMPSPAGN